MRNVQTMEVRPTTVLATAAVSRALRAVGAELNGPNPWDPQIHDPLALRRMLLTGNLGAGEAYMDGMWDCARLDELAARLTSPGGEYDFGSRVMQMKSRVANTLLNHQRAARAADNARHHYAIGNELYEAMLGPTMAYSCGYWDHATTLEEAQTAKFDLVCRKLLLEPGMRVLDVGCGWGGLMRHAATHYGVSVVGLTPVEEQAEFVRSTAGPAGLDVTVLVQDYREPVDGQFDRIMSVGMFEHVGPKNYRTFFRRMHQLLRGDGLLLLHTIGGTNATSPATDPWFATYIFPGGVIPSIRQIAIATEGIFLHEDLHSFGVHYDPTLMAWHANFMHSWPMLRERFPKYDERFKRMWEYYLLTCAGAFRSRDNNLWQHVLSPNGRRGGYRSVR